MEAAFTEQGICCAVVHGSMPQAQREDTLRRFKAGEFQVGALEAWLALF